jgi:hypothetical protein
MTIKKDSIKYLFELLVVFLGVTSAFMLERWAEYSSARKEEQHYLTNIYEEVQEDDTNLRKLIEYYRLKIEEIDSLLIAVDSTAKVKTIEPQIAEALFNYRFFKPSINTWESLKTSGELKLIRNFQIKIQIAKLDRTYYNLIKYQEYIEEFITQSLLNYALKHFDLSTFEAFDNQSITNPYFINVVKTYHQILQNYHNALKNAHQECLKVKKQLEDKQSK